MKFYVVRWFNDFVNSSGWEIAVYDMCPLNQYKLLDGNVYEYDPVQGESVGKFSNRDHALIVAYELANREREGNVAKVG